MKKLLTLALCVVFLYSCGEKEAVITDATETDVPKMSATDSTKNNIPETVATTAETTVRADGFTLDGIEFAAYPCDDFEPLFVHTVFPNMGNYIVFGLVEDEPKEVFAFYKNSVDEGYVRIVCSVPEGIEYDRAIPVYSGHGGGSGEVQFAVMLEKGNERIYVAFDNFTYTDFTDWHVFNGYIITEETHDYIFEEINKSRS